MASIDCMLRGWGAKQQGDSLTIWDDLPEGVPFTPHSSLNLASLSCRKEKKNQRNPLGFVKTSFAEIWLALGFSEWRMPFTLHQRWLNHSPRALCPSVCEDGGPPLKMCNRLGLQTWFFKKSILQAHEGERALGCTFLEMPKFSATSNMGIRLMTQRNR